MKKTTYLTVTILCLGLILAGCQTSTSRKEPANTSWWPTKATPQPVKASDRNGEYWWPTNLGNETNRLWGNRGYVYVVRHDGGEAESARPVQLPAEVKPVEAMKLRDVHFHYDSAELTPAATELMAQVAALLQRNSDLSVTIEGHACSCGGADYNIGLARDRAESVLEYLAQNGVDRTRLQAVSYGETRPVVEVEDVPKCVLLPQDSQIRKNHALNRRVEFRLE